MRLSIDTVSDLNFFKFFLKVKNFNKFTLKYIRNQHLTKINEHVLQRKVGETYDKKIFL